MSKIRTAFFCQQCGYEAAKWNGRCPSCGEWNTFVEEKVQKVHNTKDPIDYGDTYYEILPGSPWNYALINHSNNFTLEKKNAVARYPWSLENAPIVIKTRAKRIPSWGLYNEMAGPLPFSTTYQMEVGEEEEITLVPYGCTKLRISQFPVVDK